MPYIVRKIGSKWHVMGPQGQVMGKHTTKKKAEAQQAALYAREHGMRKK